MTSLAPTVFGLTELTSQAQIIFILLLLFGACAIAYYGFVKHSLGKGATIVAILLLAIFVFGIASSGPGGIAALGAKLVALITN